MEITIAVAVAVGFCGLLVWVLGSRGDDGWWVIDRGPSVGEGVYRAASPARTVRRVPIVVRFAIALGFAWSALTCAVFAPAVVGIALGALASQDAWHAGALIGLLIEGIAFAIALAWTASSLLRSRSARIARVLAIWSVLHHGAIVWAFASSDLAPYAVGLSALGLAHAVLLMLASMARPSSAALGHQAQ